MISHTLCFPPFNPEDFENLENYRPGGYHPVSLHDTFCNGRYTIMQKLGFGTTSTVWLARDWVSERFVCLKIRIADACQRKHAYESEIHRYLGGWLAEFDHYGPNGTHRCVVSEVIGPSLATVERIEHDIDPMGDILLLHKRAVAARLAHAVAAMHARGIVHGNLHYGNILFRIPSMAEWTVDSMYEFLGEPQTFPVPRRRDGLSTDHMPHYLVMPLKTTYLLSLSYDEIEICLVDFGFSFFYNPNSCVRQAFNAAIENSAPEVIFNDAVSPAVDIWAMACIFFRLFQDEMLCTKASSGNIADEMIFNIVSASDKLPERWWGMWQNWNGRRRRCLLPSKEQQVQWVRKLELKDSCIALMLDMLKLEPGERICAAEVVARFPVEWLLAIEEAPEFCAPPETPPSQEERDQMELKNTECKRMVQEIQEERRLNGLSIHPAYGPERPPCQQRQHQIGPLQGQFNPQNALASPPVMQPQATHEQLYLSPDNHPEADGDHYTEMLQNSCLFE